LGIGVLLIFSGLPVAGIIIAVGGSAFGAVGYFTGGRKSGKPDNKGNS